MRFESQRFTEPFIKFPLYLYINIPVSLFRFLKCGEDIIKCLPDTKNYQKKLKYWVKRNIQLSLNVHFNDEKKSRAELFEAGLR